MSSEFPSGQRALRPRARLLRTLGSDLISSEKVALIELVKNSYDADATVVLIRFQELSLGGTGRVEIWDDGHGMDADTLQNSWLDIATDTKKKRTTSESGRRRMLGEKGIGRLAAARLGSEMLLVTKRASQNEVQLMIDWTQFDREDAYLDEIEVAWWIGDASIFSPTGKVVEAFSESGVESWHADQGTLVQIDILSRAWVHDDFLELRTALSRLVRPTTTRTTHLGTENFRIVLELPSEFSSLSGVVEAPEELDTPHYKLTGTVDSNGLAQLRYAQLIPNTEMIFSDFWLWHEDGRAPLAGPLELDIEVWDRDTAGIRQLNGAGKVSDFRRLLDRVAGVSVYRDGFRVLPFGEVGDDWLGLDRRRIQNPTLKVSNNQVIGHIFIGADENSDLRDQTNREGLLAGHAYEDLQLMIQNALALIEARRYVARRVGKPRNEARGGLFRRFGLGEIRSALVAKYPGDLRLIGLIDAKNQDIQEGIEEVQRVLSQYSRLATLGSLIDRVLHDGRTAVTQLKSIVRFGKRDFAKQSLSIESKLVIAHDGLDSTLIQADLLASLFNQIEPFSGRKRGRPKTVSLRDIINSAVEMFVAEAEANGVELDVEGEDLEVRVDPSEILTVLVNLIQNALHWLGTVPKANDRRILICFVRNDDTSISISVSDSGPGVPEDLREAIFDAYFSNRPNGVGLGLSIAGNIIQELYDGHLILLESGPLPGATFEATLRKRV